ncbi:hypothetical protein ABZY58_29120 [Micromonospora tulbaghiae]|uniref:hypothetical protein n=1 Tax=Micromonospora tulbaghiae TaxID=479978 RepID=UPI0033A4E288
MSISTDSASATIARRRRLHALDALEQAVDGRDARPLHEVVTDNLREVWKNGGRKRDDKPGLQPESILIRDAFVATTAEDAHGPALPRLVQSKGLQLRLYLLMLFDAQCRHTADDVRVRNVRTVSPSNGPYRSWGEIVLSAPDHQQKQQPIAWQIARRRRERQIKEAMLALETTPRLLNIDLTNNGRKRRNYDKPTLLAEDSTPDAQAHYGIPTVQCFRVPREFFTNLWVFALTDTEIACYLALRWAFEQAPMADRTNFFIVSQERETRLRLTRTTWDSIERLQAYGLIRRNDFSGRDPVTGHIESFRDKWQAGEVASPRYAFYRDGVKRPALRAMRNALLNPVVPVPPDPLNVVLTAPAAQAAP